MDKPTTFTEYIKVPGAEDIYLKGNHAPVLIPVLANLSDRLFQKHGNEIQFDVTTKRCNLTGDYSIYAVTVTLK